MQISDPLIPAPGGWDYREVAYGVVAAFVFAFLAKGTIVGRTVLRVWRNIFARDQYRSALRSECENLIVVGMRAGFRMQRAFVELDVAASDLSQGRLTHSPAAHWSTGAVVLVGGPGAGKSTLVKNRILNAIGKDFFRPLPLLLKLRDYVGHESIEAAFVSQFTKFRFDDPSATLRAILVSPEVLCVLDGLDEVRQELRPKVVNDINAFFHANFAERGSLVVTCRKEAYRDVPLDIPAILEVCPLSDEQIKQFATKWPPGFPQGKSEVTFWRDLTATPRIHELARSPLLLVGGLMQYTESNQGIPDDRYQYLARVARWLIYEWSTAQGHPPDPLRPVYDRLLPRIALEMHDRRAAELTVSDAANLIDKWLPSLGYGEVRGSQVIHALRNRTGILVIDDRQNLVFAQFGMQEYFASVELASQVETSAVVLRAPSVWWREVILLAVAQQHNPTRWLEAIFAVDPFVAAAAVAECSTPSDTMQRRAVKACLVGVDSADSSVSAALVPLLRKVHSGLEKEFIHELEGRLNLSDDRARIVGLALATSGTATATEALARHSEVWAECLSSAGYVSESFESLLIGWVRDATDEQSATAATILSRRLRASVVETLLGMLPGLGATKADFLAQVLLEHAVASASGDVRRMDGLRIVARCAPHIGDATDYVRKWCARHASELSDDAVERAGSDVLRAEPVNPLTVAVMLSRDGDKRRSSAEIRDILGCAIAWRVNRGLLVSMVLTGLLIATALTPGMEPKLAILAAVICMVAVVLRHGPRDGWFTRGSSDEERTMGAFSAISLIVLGGLFALGSEPTSRGILILAAPLCLMHGMWSTVADRSRPGDHEIIRGEAPSWPSAVAMLLLLSIFGVLVLARSSTPAVVVVALWVIAGACLIAAFYSDRYLRRLHASAEGAVARIEELVNGGSQINPDRE